MKNRSAGILLHISSLPSRYGIGCFDKSAYEFVDFLKASGQSFWQILPLGPTGYGDSPYQSFSAFAGNPYFIDLTELIEEGLLTAAECERADAENDPSRVDYGRLYKLRLPLLMKAYKRAEKTHEERLCRFAEENDWADNYALFMALKSKAKGAPFTEWVKEIRLRESCIMEKCRWALKKEIGFHIFTQYYFYRQWLRLKEYANKNGIAIIGDIPIYTAADSADVWENPQLFQLDENLFPKAVAGCPPDGFSADGQLWGNPLYNWEEHRKTGYSWWIKRLSHCFKLYDTVRIDHFRGFDEYYSIPYGEKNAVKGHWEKGAGAELFRAAEKSLGKMKVIAEDLGFMTDSVKRLVQDTGFPNMKVLQFGFDSRDTGNRADYLPHNYPYNCAAYTGTHDNQTITSWLRSITPEEKDMVREYLCDDYTPDSKLYKSLISLVMRSGAELAVIPMQDWLGLDDRSRMNTPSVTGGNWQWRMKKSDMNEELAAEILKTTKIYGRKETI